MLKFLSKNICLFLWFQISFESLGNVLFTFSLKIFLKTSCNFRKKFAYVSYFIFVFVNGAFFFNWRLCVQAGFDFCMLMLHPVTLSNSLKSTLVCWLRFLEIESHRLQMWFHLLSNFRFLKSLYLTASVNPLIPYQVTVARAGNFALSPTLVGKRVSIK